MRNTPPADGFLSPEISEWARGARASAPQWFSLLDNLNRTAVRLIATLAPRKSSPKEMMAASLFARALQTFEATILLVERGMLADAGTTARSLVETAIFLGGVALLPDFLERMAKSSNSHYYGMARAIAEHLEGDGGENEAADAAELRQLIQETKGNGIVGQDIKLRALAHEVGMDPLYEILFRELSGDSAHPSISAGERHIVRGEGGQILSLLFSPQSAGMERIISGAISAFLGTLEAVGWVFSREDISVVVTEFNTLHHAAAAATVSRLNGSPQEG